MKELEFQKVLKDCLNVEAQRFKIDFKVVQGEDFKNLEGKKRACRPDLVVFHNIDYSIKYVKHNPKYTETIKHYLQSPIGIEFKRSDTSFNNIPKGISEQLHDSYRHQEFYCKEFDIKFKLNSLAFANTSGCTTGFMYDSNFKKATNFFVERFCWKMGIATLYKPQDLNQYCFTIANYRFLLNGQKQSCLDNTENFYDSWRDC